MILQQLCFPDGLACPKREMYYRGAESARWDGRALRLSSGQTLRFDTYFNSFSAAKWRRYTRLDSLRLRLELEGALTARLLNLYLEGGEVCEETLAERECRCDRRTAFALDVPVSAWERGIVCFSLEGEGALYGGGYETDADEAALNRVDIAVDICTFRREAYVERNLQLLRRALIDDPSNPVHGHLEVFISDNGRTLDAAKLAGERVHIYPNPNVGGAGGFTRGMLEILDQGSRFTHALVMDDDVLINADAIARTCRLLQFMKPEYLGKTVAGAMLRLDERHVQHECGGRWDGGRTVGLKTFLDLSEVGSVLRNEEEEPLDYSAWWYSCIPVEKIESVGLPLPLFIYNDDVEYGLRTGGDVIAMNGICLWHEPFENKYACSTEYYHLRNALIVDALHRPDYGAKDAVANLRGRLLAALGRYRYANCALICRAAEDFLKGPEFLMALDAEALHRDLQAASYRLEPLEKLPVPLDETAYARSMRPESRAHKLLRLLTLNRLLLPRHGDGVAHVSLNGVKDFAGRRRVLNYEPSGRRGFVTEHDARKALEAVRRGRRTMARLRREYDRAAEAYRRAFPELTSAVFWNRYLGR